MSGVCVCEVVLPAVNIRVKVGVQAVVKAPHSPLRCSSSFANWSITEELGEVNCSNLDVTVDPQVLDEGSHPVHAPRVKDVKLNSKGDIT